mgnify:CR=1 FL=1
MLKYLSVLITFQIPYLVTKLIIGGLAHIPVLIFIFNEIKNKFDAKAQLTSIS